MEHTIYHAEAPVCYFGRASVSQLLMFRLYLH